MKVSDFVEGKLMEIGATPEYTGYKYLVCAIVMSMQNEYLLNNVTTKMYPAIGKRYGVSPASIERSIRTVISPYGTMVIRSSCVSLWDAAIRCSRAMRSS